MTDAIRRRWTSVLWTLRILSLAVFVLSCEMAAIDALAGFYLFADINAFCAFIIGYAILVQWLLPNRLP